MSVEESERSDGIAFNPPLLQRTGRRPVRVESVDAALLQPVSGRPPLDEYVHQLWRRRHFIVADARARVVSGTAGNLLGRLWLVLSPVLDGAAYYLMFGLLLRSDRGIENFLGYLIIGVFLFGFTTRCLTQGARSVLAGQTLVKSFRFPRAALPVAVVAREALSFVPALAAMVGLILLLPPSEHVTWRWLLVPAVLALQAVFNIGLALLAARATAHIPDLSQLIGVLCRFWLYGSAVFFSFERFIDHPTLLAVVQANPMFVVLDMTRDCLLYATTPSWTSWVQLAGWSVGVLVVGLVYFWRGEETYGSL